VKELSGGKRGKPSPAVECSIKVGEKDESIPRPTSGNYILRNCNAAPAFFNIGLVSSRLLLAMLSSSCFFEGVREGRSAVGSEGFRVTQSVCRTTHLH
jgi:hypothetical protein